MREPQRITLVNVWHDDNKGDGGIGQSVLHLLKKRWPEAQYGVISMFPKSSSAFQSAHRHLKATFPEIKVESSPFSNYDPSKRGGLFRQVQKLWQVPISIIQLLPIFSRNHPALCLISESDLVVANGGQYLFTHQDYLNSLFTVFRILYPILLAKSYGIPYLLASQSFGFHKANRLDNRLVRFTLSSALEVWARETISYKELLDLGLSESSVQLVPDAAFALTPSMTPLVSTILEQHQLKDQGFWVITVRSWKSYTEGFLDEIVRFVRQALYDGMIEKIALVAHAHGPSDGENDRLATRKLAQCLAENANVVVVEDDLSPSELSALYSKAQLMIGTRFHSVIFSLIGGTPAYAISYAGPKTWGIMEMLGMKDLCSDMQDFSADSILETLNNLDIDAVRSGIPDKMNILYAQLEQATSTFLDKKG